MNNDIKLDSAYRTIGEITKELGLVDEKTGNSKTYVLRYWETQFKQIKPLIRAGKRRYYSRKDFRTIKLIKFLLKDKGLTIKGVKKILNDPKSLHLDGNTSSGVYKANLESAKIIKTKIKKISKIVAELKKLK